MHKKALEESNSKQILGTSQKRANLSPLAPRQDFGHKEQRKTKFSGIIVLLRFRSRNNWGTSGKILASAPVSVLLRYWKDRLQTSPMKRCLVSKKEYSILTYWATYPICLSIYFPWKNLVSCAEIPCRRKRICPGSHRYENKEET